MSTPKPRPHPDPQYADPFDAPDRPDAATLDAALAEHRVARVPRFQKLWRYYRNPVTHPGPPARFAQEEGLPDRLRDDAPGQRRERVIENDIAWRIHTLVDFMFGRPIALQSTADDPDRADAIEAQLRRTLDEAGGVRFLQDLALLGAVHGQVDVAVRVTGTRAAPTLSLDLIDAPRAVPFLDPADYRRLNAYAVTHRTPDPSHPGRCREHTTVFTRDAVETHLDPGDGPSDGSRRRLVKQRRHPLGVVPVVHIQNLPQPFHYAGLSDVEPLIPLQDELNTRLSDRANRVTFQAFRMYLGKGIEGFTDRPVGPGQMWSTDNPDASIQSFGGDAHTPSEDAHIAEVRRAMDQASGVPPAAAGVLTGKVGNLSSENALRLVFMGLLAKTEKKRTTYGRGLQELFALILHALDATGAFPNHPAERGVRIDWPHPIPTDEQHQLRNAQLKRDLGVPPRQLLAELGYDPADTPD